MPPEKLFVIHRPKRGEPTPPSGRAKTMEGVEARAKKFKGPYLVHRRGVDAKEKFARRKAALFVFRKKLDRLGLGQVLVLEGRGGDIHVRRVEVPSVELPAQAVFWPKIQKKIYTWSVTNFPELRYAGTCNCRDTRQGGSLSDHACCHASDWFPPSKAYGDKYVAAVKREFGDVIIYVSWQVYLHYDHAHVATGKCSHCF